MAMWVRKTGTPVETRGELLARIEKRIRMGNPRLLMSAIVAATGAAGLFASVVLHHGGILRMSLRYGLSVAFAYFAFMFFVWLWILVQRHGRYDDPGAEPGWPEGDDVDVQPVVAVDDFGPDAPAPSSGDPAPAPAAAGQGGGSFDLDDGVVVVAVVAAIAAAAAASFYVVFIAPEFLAELLLDGVLATALYRRLRATDRRHWFESALSRTWIPALAVAILFVIAGGVCQWYAPEATSLTGVFEHWRAK